MRVALDFEVSCKKKRGRPKITWKKQVQEETEKVGFKTEDLLNQVMGRSGAQITAERMGKFSQQGVKAG